MATLRTTPSKDVGGAPLVFTSVKIGEHKLPNLPYEYNALEPYIDETTMRLHHTKHQQAYVDGLNKAELALQEARRANDYKTIALLERQLAFHGSGHANHITFFNGMRSRGGAQPEPEGSLAGQIQVDFGGFDKLKDQFTQAAQSVEGNGWGALVYDTTFARLYTMGFMNHQNLSIPGSIPLLLVDVWEHAYYLLYQNRRLDYINAWWNVVDWSQVESRFQKYTKCTL
jgi:Fe-Mn family superoxide dismutase